MQYLIGAIITLLFFICIGLSAYIGYRLGQKPKVMPVDEKKQREIEKKQQAFEAVMNYDLNTAMGRKK